MTDSRLSWAGTVLAASFAFVAAAFADCRPEVWFHVIGGNASKSGITADLEWLRDSGIGGIQFFHGQVGDAVAWDGVGEQIPCLSEKWDDLVAHAAGECSRLGMTFKMQNCPGWSMSGGPWISPSNAMRKLVFARRDVLAGCSVPDIPVPAEFLDDESDWHDVCFLAFPTPYGDGPDAGLLVPSSVATNGNVRTFRFGSPVSVRTVELPPPRWLNPRKTYAPDVRVWIEAKVSDGWRLVRELRYPKGCWQDAVPFSVACGEALSAEWRLELIAPYPVELPFVRFLSCARLDNWEGLSGQVLRGRIGGAYPRQSESAYIPARSIRLVSPGDPLPHRLDGGSGWTVLRTGHVNMKKVNAPAPKEATGWECDKLDPRGVEANFAGYIGRIADGPLNGGKLKGVVVDSWECERQTWTWRMEEFFLKENGYDVKTIIPALFGWVIGDIAATQAALLDWRRTVSGLITRNYYGRMAELAHGRGLEIAYETAFGDVIPGDILEYWKWCDIPMCEFWQPYSRDGVGSPDYKPVRPCVSAAHLYGKRRVDCEAFTSTALTWDENFRTLKEQAVRHFAQGVTHLVFHTCTHNPQTDGRVPGTSFGAAIGTPFVRGQTWAGFLRPFADWTASCCEFLERGLPVVDVLRYLGDDLGHRPDEGERFPDGFKCDYLNADVMLNRLDVKDGRFVLPDGMSYSAIWIPDSTVVLPASAARLEELAAKGGRICRGTADEAVSGLEPQLVAKRPIHWYHRYDGGDDLFFVAADENGFRDDVRFSTRNGVKTLFVDLAPFETMLLEFGENGVRDLACSRRSPSGEACFAASLTDWTISFPAGWGAHESVSTKRLVPWKDMPGASDEGRAFSGTATYATTLTLPVGLDLSPEQGSVISLDLGDVRDFARVVVNGCEAAKLWSRPYCCDIAPFVRPGGNEIRIEVTSTWFNRLAWDFAQPPEKRKTWTVWDMPGRRPPCLMRGAALRDSGLLGPVEIRAFPRKREVAPNGCLLRFPLNNSKM